MNRNEQNFQNPVQIKLKLFAESSQYQQKKHQNRSFFLKIYSEYKTNS